MRYPGKKTIKTVVGSLVFTGAMLLLFSYLYTLLGPNELWHYVLRLLAVILIIAFVAMVGVSLARFEEDALEAAKVRR